MSVSSHKRRADIPLSGRSFAKGNRKRIHGKSDTKRDAVDEKIRESAVSKRMNKTMW
ncbi:MAG: hypothetical protein ACI4NO_02065 [Oxalobacter sp.]